MNTTTKARYPFSMTDAEFVSLFHVDELPECGEGLWLLKQWIESDPFIVPRLRDMHSLDLDGVADDGNPIFQKLLFHARTCDDCRRVLGPHAA